MYVKYQVTKFMWELLRKEMETFTLYIYYSSFISDLSLSLAGRLGLTAGNNGGDGGFGWVLNRFGIKLEQLRGPEGGDGYK